MTQIQAFEAQFDARYSNSYTMGLWMFIEDESKFNANDMIKIHFNKIMMMAIGKDTTASAGSQYISSVCNIYTAYYPTLAQRTNFIDVLNDLANPNYTGSKTSFSKNVSSKWFYLRCGVSFDMTYLYNLLSVDYFLNAGIANYVVSENMSFSNPSYFDYDALNPSSYPKLDFLFNYLFLNNKMKVSIEVSDHISTSVNSIFIRNLYIYSDLIKKSMGIQYYDFSGFGNNDNEFDSLLLILNLDKLNLMNGSTSSAVTISYEYLISDNSIAQTDTINATTRADATFRIPTQFYRMNFIKPSSLGQNKFFTSSNFYNTEIQSLTCDSSSNFYLCWQNNKPYYCSIGYYLNDDGTCTSTCKNNFLPNYGTITNQNITYGICTLDTTKNNIDKTNFNYSLSTTTLKCQNNFNLIHLTCYSNTKQNKGALHFSSTFNSKNINIPITQLSNYFLEVWFFSDKVFLPSPGISGIQYILVTSSIRIYRGDDYSLDNTYQIADSSGSTQSTSSFSLPYGQWHRLAFDVKVSSGTYSVNFAYKGISGNRSFQTTNNMDLTSINFCHSTTCGPITSNINWFTGFYKNIRVWDYSSATSYITDTFKK